MKKMICLALACCLLLCSAAYAIALPKGVTYDDYINGHVYFGTLELTEFVGKPIAEYEAFLADKNLNPGNDVLAVDMGSGIQNFYVYGSGYSIYGYEVDSRCDDLISKMAEEGWTIVRNQFEGGLTWRTFEKEDGENLIRFEVDACDGVVTYLSLEISKLK